MAQKKAPETPPRPVIVFRSDDERWRAVANRDPAADNVLFYSVKTTGVYCRPSCPARLALRKNVQFFSSCQAAEAAGFRPCRRCRPDEAGLRERHAAIVIQVCRLIEESERILPLDDIAKSIGLSPFHLHRLFKAQTGLTPRKYAAACRNDRLRDQLTKNTTVTTALYRAGFNSSSRLYESTTEVLGMTPTQYRTGGPAGRIQYALGRCWLGSVLVAATQQGICAILLGDDPTLLIQDLQAHFSNSELVAAESQFGKTVASVINLMSSPDQNWNLPLDIHGTAFQHRVWDALRQIPAGSTASYTEVAQRIGQPTAVRAVAHACAANPLAVAIPCHRVVRSDGSLSGYRWGIERKAELLRYEHEGGPEPT